MANIHRNISIHGLTDLVREQFLFPKTGSGKALNFDQPLFGEDQDREDVHRTPQDFLLEATTYANFASAQEVYIHKARRHETTPYTMALIDWFEAPRVLDINVDEWTGEIGQTIHVKARDNVMVAGVSLVIRDAQENVLEMGEAVQSAAGSPWWIYSTQSRVKMSPFPNVEAIARDLAGNEDSFVIS